MVTIYLVLLALNTADTCRWSYKGNRYDMQIQ